MQEEEEKDNHRVSQRKEKEKHLWEKKMQKKVFSVVVCTVLT